MSDAFNGYHVWLGIPPHEQPPNHYRLLGIGIFESDLDVIDHAADRQMAHVRTFQAGKHRALSQQMLNELSSARLCLLNPAKKVVYDEGLRAQLSDAPRAVAVGASIPMATPVAPVATAAPVSKAAPMVRAVPAAPVAPVTRMPPSSPVKSPASAAKAAPLAEILPLDGLTSAKAVPLGQATAGGRITVPGATPTGLEIDGEAMDALTSSPDFQIRVHRRNYNNTPPWKGALAYGVLTGVVFISFFLLYLLVKNLTATDEWKRFILGETDPAATAPNLPPPPVHDSTPPPAPAQATDSDPAE